MIYGKITILARQSRCFPTAPKPIKNWGEDGYTALGRMLLEKGFKVLLFGGSSQFESLKNMASSMGSGAYVPYLFRGFPLTMKCTFAWLCLKGPR